MVHLKMWLRALFSPWAPKKLSPKWNPQNGCFAKDSSQWDMFGLHLSFFGVSIWLFIFFRNSWLFSDNKFMFLFSTHHPILPPFDSILQSSNHQLSSSTIPCSSPWGPMTKTTCCTILVKTDGLWKGIPTVDGRNPKQPPGMYKTL